MCFFSFSFTREYTGVLVAGSVYLISNLTYSYVTIIYFLSGHSCLDIAQAFGDSRIIDLIKDKLNSLPKPYETKGNGNKAKKSKAEKQKVANVSIAYKSVSMPFYIQILFMAFDVIVL